MWHHLAWLIFSHTRLWHVNLSQSLPSGRFWHTLADMPLASPNLRLTRQEHGVKARELADKIDVNVKLLWNAETGRYPLAIEHFHKIARELDVPVADLLAEPSADLVRRTGVA